MLNIIFFFLFFDFLIKSFMDISSFVKPMEQMKKFRITEFTNHNHAVN